MRRRPIVPALGLALGLTGVLALSGCGTFLGEGETDAPLPGKRISILAVDRGLSPDRAIADLEVTLPPPYVNEAWSQAGGTSAHAMYHLQLGDAPKRKWNSDVGEGTGDTGVGLIGGVVDDLAALGGQAVFLLPNVQRGRLEGNVGHRSRHGLKVRRALAHVGSPILRFY